MAATKPLDVRGVKIWKQFLDPERQRALLDSLRDVMRVAPPFHPETRFGNRMSVRMTSAGQVGWVSDRRGYRYTRHHPSGVAWPPIPENVLEIWRGFGSAARPPDCCLVNFYGEGARMGLHQDRDEGDFDWPVVSVSLGDEGLFRIGNVEKGGPTESLWLHSGDVVVMGGRARLLHHGVDRIRFGSSSLLPKAGRVNITLRAVDLSVAKEN